MSVKAIVAQAENGAIGLDGHLPWRISNELKHFKATTDNSTLLVGATTWASMQGINLGNRKVIVVTSRAVSVPRQMGRSIPRNVIYTSDLYGTLDRYARSRDVLWVIGGKSIYEQSVKYISEVVLTTVMDSPEADTYLDIISLMSNLSPMRGSEYHSETRPTPDWVVSKLRIRAFQPPTIVITDIACMDEEFPDFKIQERIDKATELFQYRDLEIEISRLKGKMCLLRSESPHWYRNLNSYLSVTGLAVRNRLPMLNILHRYLDILPGKTGRTVGVHMFNVGVGGKARKRAFDFELFQVTPETTSGFQYLAFPDANIALSVSDVMECINHPYESRPIMVLNLPKNRHNVIRQAVVNLGLSSVIVFK